MTLQVNTKLLQPHVDDQADATYLRRVESLQATFIAELPVSVNERVMVLMRENVAGQQLLNDLTSMEFELPKPEDSGERQSPSTGALHVVCSVRILEA